MKTRITELNMEAQKQLFRNNEFLQEKTSEFYQEMTMFWVSDYLDIFKHNLSDWSIGFFQRNYIKVKDESRFIHDMKTFVDTFGMSESNTELVNKYIKRLGEIELMENDLEYDDLDLVYYEISDMFIKLKNILIKHFDELCDYSMYDLESYFLDDISNNAETYEDYYIIDDELTVIYEDIPATIKSHK